MSCCGLFLSGRCVAVHKSFSIFQNESILWTDSFEETLIINGVGAKRVGSYLLAEPKDLTH